MYNHYLYEIDFFNELLKTEDMSNVLDSLTPTVCRKYMMKYISYLTDNNIDFALIILDIDNFKLINDNYGHAVGDQVLLDISNGLINYIGKDGVVGRYGGDEFIIVYLKDNSFKHMYEMIYDMYGQDSVIRKTIYINDTPIFVTGTFGSSSYPLDAKNMVELFSNADKALYRGKSKGRNCFVIYIKEKHKNIDVNQMVRPPLYKIIHNINYIMERYSKRDNYVELLLNNVKSTISNIHVTYVDKDFNIYKNGNEIIENKFKEQINVENLLDEYGFFECNDLNHLKKIVPALHSICMEFDILSILICRIEFRKNDYGYLVISDHSTERIWQDEDKALFLYVSKLISLKDFLN